MHFLSFPKTHMTPMLLNACMRVLILCCSTWILLSKQKSHSPSGSWTRSVRRREKAESHQWELVHRRHHGTQAREMCPPDQNPTRAACPCSKSISHSLTSPPLWCHSFILFPFPVAMVTMPLGADHSFTSVFLSPSVSLPLSRPRWAQPTHSIWGVQLHP